MTCMEFYQRNLSPLKQQLIVILNLNENLDLFPVFPIAPPSVMMKANYRNTTEQGKDWDKINENRPAMSRSEGGSI
jgi:hypothetical protein